MDLPADQKKSLDGIVFHAQGYSGYYDRPVRGFPYRTSGHAYGIAVDINWNTSYFLGSHQGEPYRYRNNVPRFLVDISSATVSYGAAAGTVMMPCISNTDPN